MSPTTVPTGWSWPRTAAMVAALAAIVVLGVSEAISDVGPFLAAWAGAVLPVSPVSLPRR